MNPMTSLFMEESTTVLKRIEQEEKQESHWIVGPEVGKILAWLVRFIEPEVVLEIGTSVGYSAIWMASALEQNNKGKIWTIESHQSRYDMAKNNIEEAGLTHRVVQKIGHAPEIFYKELKDEPAHIDLAFFDTTKKEHPEFFEAVFPRMSSGGFIVVDNVVSHRFGIMKEFIAFMHAHEKLDTAEIPAGAGLLIARVL